MTFIRLSIPSLLSVDTQQVYFGAPVILLPEFSFKTFRVEFLVLFRRTSFLGRISFFFFLKNSTYKMFQRMPAIFLTENLMSKFNLHAYRPEIFLPENFWLLSFYIEIHHFFMLGAKIGKEVK